MLEGFLRDVRREITKRHSGVRTSGDVKLFILFTICRLEDVGFASLISSAVTVPLLTIKTKAISDISSQGLSQDA